MISFSLHILYKYPGEQTYHVLLFNPRPSDDKMAVTFQNNIYANKQNYSNFMQMYQA